MTDAKNTPEPPNEDDLDELNEPLDGDQGSADFDAEEQNVKEDK